MDNDQRRALYKELSSLSKGNLIDRVIAMHEATEVTGQNYDEEITMALREPVLFIKRCLHIEHLRITIFGCLFSLYSEMTNGWPVEKIVEKAKELYGSPAPILLAIRKEWPGKFRKEIACMRAFDLENG